jgi:hypothetical protein
MFVVRKLDRELALFLGLNRLLRIIWFAESEARTFARSGAPVTNCTN